MSHFYTSDQRNTEGYIRKPCIPHHRDASKCILVHIEMYPRKVVALQKKGQATTIKANIALV